MVKILFLKKLLFLDLTKIEVEILAACISNASSFLMAFSHLRFEYDLSSLYRKNANRRDIVI